MPKSSPLKKAGSDPAFAVVYLPPAYRLSPDGQRQTSAGPGSETCNRSGQREGQTSPPYPCRPANSPPVSGKGSPIPARRIVENVGGVAVP